MSKDHDYIKGLFDGDGISAPESLSEENMLAMLEKAEDAKNTGDAAGIEERLLGPGVVVIPADDTHSAGEGKRTRERRRISRSALKRITAVAAAAVVALFGVTGFIKVLNAPPDTSVSDGELYTFNSEKEIRNLLRSMDSSQGFGLHLGSPYRAKNYGGEEMAEAEPDIAADAAEDTGSAAAKSPAHSETYLQVEEVDEADIVKTDGKYIYYVNSDKEVVILSAKDGKTKKVAIIGNNGLENYIEDIYVRGDRLITIGTVYPDDSEEGSSGIAVYDISDRSRPSVLWDFTQTGYILSSRMVGDFVYLVTNDYVYSGGRVVPMCGKGGSMEEMQASDICCMPEPAGSSYIVLSAVDISSGEQKKTTSKAILGAGSEIYCNDQNLYAVSPEWDSKTGSSLTRIARASLDGTKVRFNGTATVRGYINDQFSMNERDGYFYIATTSERGGMEVNNLFALDSMMDEAGKVTGFARNESIKAVRYIGDKAYVITYEQIDPLFIIDLSDPAQPRIEGEVKIDGFSSLLIPISKDRLLGIGHATGDNGYGGEYDSGLKLALFDISDPSEPKVLDSKEFADMNSPAQNNHHALTVNSEAGYFAIPYEIWHWEDGPDVFTDDDVISDDAEAEDIEDSDGPGEYNENGVLVFSAGSKIGRIDQHKLGEQTIYRSVYIGDWLYALDGDGNVSAFRP